VTDAGHLARLKAEGRRLLWNNIARVLGAGDRSVPRRPDRRLAQDQAIRLTRLIFFSLQMTGGIYILDPDKTIDYRHSDAPARYAFTFWAFPRDQWLDALRGYLDFRDAHYRRYGSAATCRSGRTRFARIEIRSSPTQATDRFFRSTRSTRRPDQAAWDRFLREFNEFATRRDGIPLFNQSPFVTRAHCERAYGPRLGGVQRVGAFRRSRRPDAQSVLRGSADDVAGLTFAARDSS
jgi:hypothetical protein